MASIWKLPVLFICENNQFATEVPFSYSSGIPDVGRRAANYGLPGFEVDGNDVIANAFNFGNTFTILSVTRLEGSQNGRLVTAFNNWLLGYHGNLKDRMYAEGWVDTGTT